MASRVWICTGFILLSFGLVGCDAGGTHEVEQLAAVRRRADPPVLWSIEVVGEDKTGRPIQICANQQIVSGFSSITPASGGSDCTHDPREIIPTENGLRFRCRLKGVTYAVSSATAGDPARDFTVTSSAYPVLEDGPAYHRALRFRRIGACPTGWKLGEATDQKGARRQAIEPDPT